MAEKPKLKLSKVVDLVAIGAIWWLTRRFGPVANAVATVVARKVVGALEDKEKLEEQNDEEKERL